MAMSDPSFILTVVPIIAGLVGYRGSITQSWFAPCIAKGGSQDNAACEGFCDRLKTELFYPRDWKAATVEQFIREVDSYIRWYNERQIKISLGFLSPIECQEKTWTYGINQFKFLSASPNDAGLTLLAIQLAPVELR